MKPSTSDPGMPRKLPPDAFRERSRHGKLVTYHRVGKGKRTRLPDFGTPEFEAAYQAARAGKTVPVSTRGATRAGSLKWLVAEYSQSLHFRSLDPVTQRRRTAVFSEMVRKSGDKQISQIDEKAIIDGRERRATGRGHAANAFLKAVKPMFAYAVERRWLEINPAKNVDRLKVKIDGHKVWSLDDVAAFEQTHPVGTRANLAMRLLLFTGLRRSDAILLGRQHVKNGRLRFTPGKTTGTSGVTVSFRVLPPLIEAIDATETGDLSFLITGHNRPFSSGASFGTWFGKMCIEAGVPGRAHGLRKAGSTIAAAFGATAHELMSMWGWTTLAQAELYTRSANRDVLGDKAASKLFDGYTEMVQNRNSSPRTLVEGAGEIEIK